jgi:hypothetical protein
MGIILPMNHAGTAIIAASAMPGSLSVSFFISSTPFAVYHTP